MGSIAMHPGDRGSNDPPKKHAGVRMMLLNQQRHLEGNV